MDDSRYTSFPDLVPAISRPKDSLRTEEQIWQIDGVSLSSRIIILGWANLLHSYTGDERPVFRIDGDAVRVELLNQQYSKVNVKLSRFPEDGNPTGLFFDKVRKEAFPSLSRADVKKRTSTSDIAVEIRYDAEKAQVTLISRLNLDPGFIDQLGQQYMLTISWLVPEPSGSLQQRPSLSILNPDPAFLEGPKFLHELVCWSGKRSHPAIEFLDNDGNREFYSYQRLDELSTQMALRLDCAIQSFGAVQGGNSVIAILIPQSAALYITQIAILKAGAAFCPLNLDAPEERVKYIIKDVSAKIVVTTGSYKEKFSDVDLDVKVILADSSIVDAENPSSPVLWYLCPQPTDIAYVMYTSGSTGLPKGVGVSHRAATQALLAHNQHLPSFSRFLQFAAPTFDVSVFEIFFPLFRGSTLVCCDRGEMLTDLPGVMAKLNIDAAELTPTVAGSLLRIRAAVPTLKVLLTIGEMLTRSIVDEFGQSLEKDGILYGMYGPTEAAIHCTISPTMSAASKVGMIGKPLAPVSAFILSIDGSERGEQHEPHVLPLGQIGELAVGGYQLANGYINRPEQTAKAFVEHSEYGQMYRTGDKARLLPNGELECLGRISGGQVKLRGQRVELGEIEQVVCKTPGVQTAVATIAGSTLVVFCVNDDQSVLPEWVQETCKQWLPRFMIPGDCIMIQTAPRLPSGKIDKKKLEADYQTSKHSTRTENETYEDDLEEVIGRCANQHFDRDIGSFTSLSAAGLDSLSVIRFARLLRNADIRLSVPSILEADSIHAIHALALDLKNFDVLHETEDKESLWAIVKAEGMSTLLDRGQASDVLDVIPCAPVQQSMLVETISNPQAYFNWVQLSVTGNVTMDQIQAAFCAIASKNEILRSGFVDIEVPDHPFAQVVWRDLQSSQFQVVENFTFDVSSVGGLGLLRPLHVQLLPSDDALQLLIYLHHAIYDGWSWEIVLVDLQHILGNKLLGQRPQYRLLTRFSLAQYDSGPYNRSVEYWEEHLQALSPLPFPNFIDTSDVTPGIRTINRNLDLSLSNISTMSHKLQIGRPAFFQAAFSYLLSSYLGSPEVTFGSVSSGRTLPIDGIEEVFGPCINTLPLRVDITSCRTTGDLLTLTHNLNRKHIGHGIVPLRDIKKASRLDESKPLFDTLFVWQETLRTGKKPLANIIQIDSKDFSEFVLTLEIEPREEGVRAKATFQNSVLPVSQVELLLRQLENLVEIFAKSNDIVLDELVSSLNTSNLSIENPQFEPELGRTSESLTTTIENLASQDPDRTAIEFVKNLDPDAHDFDFERITYAALNARANKIADFLVKYGVKADHLISIIMEKSIDLYVSILAVVKAGAAYLPLTPQTPLERVKGILLEAEVRVCLTHSSQQERLASVPNVNFVKIDQYDFSSFSACIPRVKPAVEDLAYAVFTSGSTGKPKGVLVTRGNLMSNLIVLSEIYPCPRQSKLLQVCSQAFDVSVFEIFFTWHMGMCLCAATNDILFRDIEATICASQITHLSLTPTVAALINPDSVPSVRFLVTSGEGVTSKVFKDWSGRGLYQGYGPSETTNICTVKPRVLPSGAINDIGPPLKNTSAFVVSSSSKITPVLRGGIGELCFGGEQVGRGYLNLPDQTNQKFLDLPSFGRVYRSGDFGRLLPNGTILFLGRQDEQVKLRGQRIELDEINHCLLSSQYVEDCTTLVVDSTEAKSQRLVSFWKTSNTERANDLSGDELQPKCAELFDLLSSRLPDYMIPSALVPRQSLPMTDQGKIDKRQLLNDFSKLDANTLERLSRNFDTNDTIEEMSEQEQTIARALETITGVSSLDIHRHTSFFNLGLDSISAIQFSRLLRNGGLCQVDVSAILQHSSIRRLQRAISTHSNQESEGHGRKVKDLQVFGDAFLKSTSETFAKVDRRIQDLSPCTSLQEAMLAKKGQTHATAYFNHTLLQVHGETAKLKEAWKEMLSRHDILRTCFVSTDNTRYPFAQVVLKDFELPWTTVKTASQHIDKDIERLKREASATENHFTPPWGLKMVESADNSQSFLLLSMHHAMYDAEAMRQLLIEVQEGYYGVQLAPIVHFKTFLEEVVRVDNNATDEFWSEQFAQFTPIPCPKSDKLGDTPQGFETLQITPSWSFHWLEKECKRHSVSLLSVCQTAWSKLLCAYLGSSDVCFGNVFSGRNVPLEGVERIVGPCFNTLPIRTKLLPNMMNKDLALHLQNMNTKVLPLQLSSLRRIQTQNGSNGRRLFDTLVLLQDASIKLDEKIWTLENESGSMDFPIILEIQPDRESDKLCISLHFDKTCTSSEDCTNILENFAMTLQTCLQYPSGKATDLSFLRDKLPSFVGKVGRDGFDEEKAHHANGALENRDRGRKEEEIRIVLADLSGVAARNIHLDTTIFQLGLDSINAIQVAARLKKQGNAVSAADVLEAPSIRQLASFIKSRGKIGPSHIEVFNFDAFDRHHRSTVLQQLKIEDSAVESIRPCTPVQAGILAEYLHSNGELYFNHLVVKVKSSIAIAALQAAWRSAFQSLEMLRTGFLQSNDQSSPFQMITYHSDCVQLPWNYMDRRDGQPYDLLDIRSHLKKDVFFTFRLPAWRLTVWDDGDRRLLQFSAHHALYDAQSLNMIFNYVTRAIQERPDQALLPVSPTLGLILNSSAKEDDSQKFWQSLTDQLCVTKFPDLNTTRVQSDGSFCLTRDCSASLTDLRKGCKEAGITLQAASQAAWARLLSAYVGETNVTFGVVLSGRDISEEAWSVAFPCLTTVPFPCQVSGSNQVLVRRIMELNAPITKHQFTPLAKVERWASTEKGLFDSILVYQKLSLPDSMEATWEVVDEEARVSYAVSIELIPIGNERLELRLTFQERKLPREQASLLLEQLDALLRNSIFAPDQDAADMSTIDQRILSVIPPKDREIPSDIKLLHEFVEVRAKQSPDKVALEFASHIQDDGVDLRAWTYEELNHRGNQYSRLIQSVGAAPGSLIGICFDKCPEAYFAILGILKAGCAYVALDPGAPIARKDFIVKDSNSKMILCTMSQKQELRQIEVVPIVAVDEPGLLESVASTPRELTRAVSQKDTCYCLYTSGTTGTPKGCEITHENAVQAMLSFQRLFAGHWDADSRWLQFASFHFDVSVLEQYWSWSVGICVSSAPRDVIFEDIARTISRLRITHIDLTPSLARLLHPDDVPSLCRGVFITGGEQLKQEILDAWGDKEVIYNGYGPTEVTIGCTMYPRVPRIAKASNIGPQFDNVGSYVLQQNTSNPVLRGAVGELCVSGRLVGRGYLNRPELTAEKFQVLEKNGERIYRTGDMVRLLHDGSFDFLGRIDDQVKLRGQRLEIAEIDQVVNNGASCPLEVATLVLKHPKQTKEQLVSFVCRSEGQNRARPPQLESKDTDRALLSSIRTTCLQNLPGYMVPTYILALSSMPLSPNNKIDAKQLKSLYEKASIEELQNLSSLSVDESNAKSEDISRISEAIAHQLGLQASEVAPQSNIFELGLDSISAISFARALKQGGFEKARASLVMKYPVIASLATALHRSDDEDSRRRNARRTAEQNIRAFAHRQTFPISESLNINLDSIEQIAPCTPLQEGMIHRSLNSERPVYFSSFAFELDPGIDLSRLEAAWRQVQSAVQILRTTFSPTPEGYAQVVLKEAQLKWAHVNIEDSEQLMATVDNQNHHFWQQNRDLTDLLWKVTIIEQGNRKAMAIHIFHGLYDGNSFPLILEAAYSAYSTNEATVQMLSFHQILPTGPLCELSGAKDFWVHHLSQANDYRLPLEETAPENKASIATRICKTPHGLQRTRRQLNVTDQSLLHASWILALRQQFKFVPTLGVVVSGRAIDIEGAESVIGPMFNTIPSNVQLTGVKTLSELVQKCHEYNVSTLPFQHTPLRNIMKWCRRNQDNSLFETLFVYQKDPAHLEGQKLWTQLDTSSEPDYPLAFEAQSNHGNTLSLTIVAQSNVVSVKEAKEMLNHVEECLYVLAKDPHDSLPFQSSDSDNRLRYTTTSSKRPAVDPQARNPIGDIEFLWTKAAKQIRQELCALADADESTVHHDVSIFELGLDSIDAIKLSSRLSKFGMKLPVASIMRCRTIEKMSTELGDSSDPDHTDSAGKSIDEWAVVLEEHLQRTGHDMENMDQVLPPTPLQESMIAEMVGSNFEHYFNRDVLEIEPEVDIERLLTVWKFLTKKHAILRTSFVEMDSPDIPFVYVQMIRKSWELRPKVIEVADDKALSEEVDREQMHKPSSLYEPPFLITLVHSQKRAVLILSIAHALYDGWSLGLLHHDIKTLYYEGSVQRPPYSGVLRTILNSSGEGAARFWQGTLAGVSPTLFPVRPEETTLSTVHRMERTSQVSLHEFKSFCKSQGITPQALGLASWSLLLAHNARRLDVVFGVVLSGRDSDEAAETMFPTMNTVAVRSVLHGSRGEMARYMQDVISNVNKYQHFPLRKAKASTASSALDLFNTLFIYQRRPEPPDLKSKVLYRSIGGSSEVEYPVCVELEIEGEHLTWRTACNDSVLSESGTNNLLHQIDIVLQSILCRPEDPVINFSGQETSISGLPAFTLIEPSSPEQPKSINDTPGVNNGGWSRLEKEIRSVLGSVAGVPESDIKKTMTIFHLGLDSISAIKVSSLLRRKSIVIGVSEMLRAATIPEIARAVGSRTNVAAEEAKDTKTTLRDVLRGIDMEQAIRSLDLTSTEVESVMPATASQVFMLSAWQNSEGAIFYPVFQYEMRVSVNRDILDKAWSNLIRHLPILRTVFLPRSGGTVPYLQIVKKNDDNAIRWEGKSNFGMLRNTRSPFTSPPVALFASVSPESTKLSVHIHHALYDGVSLPKLIQRLKDLCNDLNPRQDAQLDLADLIAYNHTHSSVSRRKLFWENYLQSGSCCLSNINEAPLGERCELYHPGLIEDIKSLETVTKQNGISIQSLFLAASARIYTRLLSRLQPTSKPKAKIIIGVYLANRSHALVGLPDLIAPTMNLVPILIKNSCNDNLISVAHNIQADLHDIGREENSCVSLVEIEKWTGVKVDCFVNFLKLPDTEDEDDENGKEEGRIRVIEVEEKETPALPSVDDSDKNIPPEQERMVNNPVGDVYVPSIDIEAAVRGNALDCGIFGPRRLLDEKMATKFIDELRDILMEIGHDD